MRIFIQRRKRILIEHLGQTVSIYSGNFFKNIVVTKEIIGFRFGAFVFTRKRGVDSKKKK
jgi:ribosomal protein S19